jgi:hypothetical protein
MATNRKDSFFKEGHFRIGISEWQEIKKEGVSYHHLIHLGLMTLKGSIQVVERFEIQDRAIQDLKKKIADLYLRLQKIENKRGGI